MTPGSDTSLSNIARDLWRGWSPRRVGLVVMAAFLVPLLGTIWNMHKHSQAILMTSIKEDLLVAAMAAADAVDPAVHASLKDRAQESSVEYSRQISRFLHLRPIIDPRAMIKFIYTCIEKDGKIYFVLDDTPEGDADHDGVDDKSHIMEPYPEASDALLKALHTGTAAVNNVPYQDKWGTFISGYAPIFDAHHHVVAVAGVDLALKDYDLQLSGIQLLSALSTIGALGLSWIAGLTMSHYHRRLQGSIGELITLGDAAMDASKAKSDFLATMSHELRTPLNAIAGHAELLADSAQTRGQKESVATIQRAADSLHSMITDILEYSSTSGASLCVEHKPLDLGELFDELRTHFAPAAKTRGLDLQVNLDPRCPGRVMGDRVRLRHLLGHLLANAIKFSDHGRIQVEAFPEGEDKLHFLVRDTGMGMSGEQQRRLFEMFSQGDGSSTRSHGGMGIGLAVCRRICDAMEGHIWVDSRAGGGSTFHIVLPAENVPAPGDVWLVTRNNLTTILVRSVMKKINRKMHLVTDFDSVAGTSHDIVLVDLATEDIASSQGRRVIGLNASGGILEHSSFEAVLTTPVKPGNLMKLLSVC